VCAFSAPGLATIRSIVCSASARLVLPCAFFHRIVMLIPYSLHCHASSTSRSLVGLSLQLSQEVALLSSQLMMAESNFSGGSPLLTKASTPVSIASRRADTRPLRAMILTLGQ